MLKKFPKCWPYSNNLGLVLEKEELNKIIQDILDYFSPRSIEFGLELTYIILWGMEVATSTPMFTKVVSRLFARALLRSIPVAKKYGKTLPYEEGSQLDLWCEDFENKIILQESFNALVEHKYTLKELMQKDRIARHRIIKKLTLRNKGNETHEP